MKGLINRITKLWEEIKEAGIFFVYLDGVVYRNPYIPHLQGNGG